MLRILSVKRLVGLAVALCLAGAASGAAGTGQRNGFTALVFSKTAGFRHGSIPNAVAAMRRLARENDFTVDATEDARAFTPATLGRYDAVVFLLTTGDVLNAPQQAAFERYVEAGGGYVGVHSAADTEYGWPWYGRLLGSYFKSHPRIQSALVRVSDPLHASTAPLPARWQRTDEWYNFARNPRRAVHVLATVDEATYFAGPNAMGADHPIAWCHEYAGGRAWYTAMGHTRESYSDPLFLRHLLGGLRYAAGMPRAGTIRGTRGADVIACTPGNDRIQGFAGADVIRAGRGNDRIAAGAGDDRVDAGPGNDVVLGGAGRDRLNGGTGHDRLAARGRRRDLVICGTGRDRAVADRIDIVRGCERTRRR